MATSTGTWSPRNIVIAAVLISAIVGSVSGLATNYLTRTSPSPENREFYLFARDLSFHFNQTSGANRLTSDYIYSSNYIIVNKGDNLVIHFYNPTDEPHSFTMAAPYTNNATLPEGPTDTSLSDPIPDVTIAITANQAGTFLFHCVFHPPQMRGWVIVQG